MVYASRQSYSPRVIAPVVFGMCPGLETMTGQWPFVSSPDIYVIQFKSRTHDMQAPSSPNRWSFAPVETFSLSSSRQYRFVFGILNL